MDSEIARRTGAGRARRGVLLFAIGVLALQAAWILSIPAFRGIDEIDHTYRAASVVRGDLVAGDRGETVPDGRGVLVKVPAALVEAAAPACNELKYYGPGNCTPKGAADRDGNVRIPTSATYMPIYYAIVGWPSLVLDGEAALYAMRMVSGLVCAALLTLAAAVAINRRAPWHLIALMTCMTPTVVYASTIVAPNGWSIAGGLLMWSSWILIDTDRPWSDNSRLMWFGAIGAIACTLGHNTGPIWVIATGLVFAVLWHPWTWRRSSLRVLLPPALAIMAAFATTVLWSLTTGTNRIIGKDWHSPKSAPDPQEVVMLPVRWLFQSVFGAPRPGGMTFVEAYGVTFAVIAIISVAGFKHASRRARFSMASIALVLVALPLVLTWQTYSALGFAWQGRYSIPLGAGILVLSADALQRRVRFTPVLLGVLVVLAGLAVVSTMSARENVAAEGAQFLTSPWVISGMCLLAFSTWAAALWPLASVHDVGEVAPVRARARAK